MFEKEKIYHRRRDLHDQYGGNPYGGIAPCPRHGIVLLFHTDRGCEFGYTDGWVSDSEYRYTGEGQKGDQQLNRGNGAIYRHKRKGYALHLFEAIGDGYYRYEGELELLDYEMRDAHDAVGRIRKVVVFRLSKYNG